MGSENSAASNAPRPDIPVNGLASAERREPDSPNLRRLKTVVSRLQDAQNLTADEIAAAGRDPRWGILRPALRNLTYPVNHQVNAPQREQLIGQVYDDRAEQLEPKPGLTVDQQIDEAISDYHHFLAFEQFMVQTQGGIGGDPELTRQLMERLAGPYKMVSLHKIIDLGLRLFSEDAMVASGLPYRQDSLGRDKGYTLEGSLESLAAATADPELKSEYRDLLDPLNSEEYAIGVTNPSNKSRYKVAGHGHSHRTAPLSASREEEVRGEAIGNVINDFRWDSWGALEPTPENSARLYELIEKQAFIRLYAGGRESWDGTGVAGILGTLRDPRALPGLIRHLEMFGSGHTSVQVVSAIWETATDPNSPEELRKVIAESPVIQRRILEDWIVHPSDALRPVIKRVKEEGYLMAATIQRPEQHFGLGRLVELAAEIRAAQGSSPLDEDILVSYFLGQFADYTHTDQVDDVLVHNIPQTAPRVIEARMTGLKDVNPKLINALVSPGDRNYISFPRLVAERGLGASAQALAKLDALYETKDLKTGSLARVIMAEGLLFLNAREDGRILFDQIMTAVRVSSREPGRLREVFRMMQTLDRFGDFESPQITPEMTVDSIIADLRERVVIKVAERMELTDAELPALREGLPGFLESGIIDIVPTLLAGYTAKGLTEVSATIRDIGRHIILGDIRDFRYASETSRAQLAALPNDRILAWVQPAPEMTLSIGASSGNESRRATADAVKRIAQEAKAHILEAYKLEFTPERVRHLEMLIREIVQSLKRADGSVDKRQLGMQRRSLEAEKDVVEGIMSLESLDAAALDPVKLVAEIGKLTNSMKIVGGLDQPAQDLAQVERVLSTQERLATVSKIRVYETDDAVTLLKIGVEPRETCQSWRNGGYNQGLPSNVVDANKRAINVVDEHGQVLARTVEKLTHRRLPDGTFQPVILLEPIYTTSEHPQFYRAIARMALAKAKATGARVMLSSEMEVMSGGVDNSRMIPVLSQEAGGAGFSVSRDSAEVYIPQSGNQYEYTDTLGGLVSWFDRYESRENMVIVEPTAGQSVPVVSGQAPV